MGKYLANAFSAQMLRGNCSVKYTEMCPVCVATALKDGFVSCVGHEDTAAVFSHELGIHVPCDRTAIKLDRGDQLYIGQLSSGRLPIGATRLPADMRIKWWRAEVVND